MLYHQMLREKEVLDQREKNISIPGEKAQSNEYN